MVHANLPRGRKLEQIPARENVLNSQYMSLVSKVNGTKGFMTPGHSNWTIAGC